MSLSNVALVFLAAAAGAVGGAVTMTLITPEPIQAGVADGSSDARIDELRQSQLRLETALADLRAAQALLAARPERVAAAVDANAPSQPSSAAPAPTAAQETATLEQPLTVESAMAQLADPDSTYSERMALWEKVNKAGLLDAVVDAMKERVDREPNNPDLRVELGNAYLQEVFAASDLSKGKWAVKADEAFDAALKLDPSHWEARFTKAVSLSHWPAIFGQQPKAISEFETLIQQQNAGPRKDEHAQTYLYLGNMYQSSGSVPKAIETYRKGLELFPDNPQLKQHLADAQKL